MSKRADLLQDKSAWVHMLKADYCDTAKNGWPYVTAQMAGHTAPGPQMANQSQMNWRLVWPAIFGPVSVWPPICG
jgi:hypothetical protein